MFKKLTVVSAALVACVLLMPGLSLAAKDHSQKPTLTWTQLIDSHAPVIHGIAYSGSLYNGGWYTDPDSLTPKWRVEKRDTSSGRLVTSFGTNGAAISDVIGEVTAFAADSVNLYAAGVDQVAGTDYEWRIEKRDLNTGALNTAFGTGGVVTDNPSPGDDYIVAVVIDDSNNSLYIVGYSYILGPTPQYQIERRDLHTGVLVAEFGTGGVITENPSGDGLPFAAALDSGGLYVGGFDIGGTGGAPEWRIEKRNLTSGALLNGFGSGGAVTEYISGATSGADLLTALAVNSSALYAAGIIDAGIGGGPWRIEKRDTTTGQLISGFGSGGVISETADSNGGMPTSIVLDSTGLYVGGYTGQLLFIANFSVNSENNVSIKSDPIFKTQAGVGDSKWRVEKRDLSSGALSGNFGDNGVYSYNPNTTSADLDELFNLAIDDDGLYLFGMSNPTGMEYSWVIQDLQFPTTVAAATSTSILPETGAGSSGSSNNLSIIAAIIPLILVVGGTLLIRSRSRV